MYDLTINLDLSKIDTYMIDQAQEIAADGTLEERARLGHNIGKLADLRAEIVDLHTDAASLLEALKSATGDDARWVPSMELHMIHTIDAANKALDEISYVARGIAEMKFSEVKAVARFAAEDRLVYLHGAARDLHTAMNIDLGG